MAKTLLLGLGALGLTLLAAGWYEADATPGSGCKQWAVQDFNVSSEDRLPEGWEPFATSVGHGGVGWGGAVARHCIKE